MSRNRPKVPRPGMRPEYDFAGGVRGKYYKRYHEDTKRSHSTGATAAARRKAPR